MKKNLIALGVGVVISFLFLGTVEIFFRLERSYGWLKKKDTYLESVSSDEKQIELLKMAMAAQPEAKWEPLNPVTEHENLKSLGIDHSQKGALLCCIGRRPLKRNTQVESRLLTIQEKRLIYKVHMTYTSDAFRMTPVRSNAKYNILMFGDSFTLGEGVNDNETGAAQLAKMRPEAQVYNLGLSGGGLSEVFLELDEDPEGRIKSIPSRKSIVLYTYIDDHMERLFCRSLCLWDDNRWMQSKPYYIRYGDGFKRWGFFDLDRPLINFFYRIINASAFVNYYNIVIPLRFNQSHYDFFGDMVLETKKLAEQRLKDVEFYFVIFPGQYHSEHAYRAVKDRGIKILNYSGLDLNSVTYGKSFIPGDGHPSPLGHYIFAYLLNRDLLKPEENKK